LLLQLGGELFRLFVRELELTVKDQAQLIGAGIQELRFLQAGGLVRAGGQRRFKTRAFL
jgi:hypothetical protein